MFYRQCPSGSIPHIIKPGDTLYRLAIQYHSTVQAILAANPGIDPRSLRVAQQICIPQVGYLQCPEGNSYSIQPRDTFYAIARFFNISVDDLKEANPMVNPNRLQIGQVICIPLATPPVNCPMGIFPYIVKQGDTFYSISQRFGVTVNELELANRNINPMALLIGQKLCIPKTGRRYLNEQLNVNFLYPINWSKVNEYRYEGPDGFFQVAAVSGESLEQVCRNEATHALKPYGSDPTIVETTIDNQNACFIFPYSDQPPEMKGQSALIVIYPRPVTIDGQSYEFFILWADQSHIREIAATVTFLR